jgi:glycosyltransferase involved in cell wall biosynthesis
MLRSKKPSKERSMTAGGPSRVTVTIPTYNRAHLLREAIQSVLGQSLIEIELFVSDNASTDDTASAVASFNDPRVHYVRNDSNIGHLANMSRGFRFGTAPFLTILPDDDVMLPGSLERKVRLLEEHPHVGLAHSASKLVHVGPDGEVLTTNVYYTGGRSNTIESAAAVLRRLLTDSSWINFPAALIRRSLVGDARFDAADGLADDLGMFLRLVRQADAVAYIAEPLVALRMHSGAVSSGAEFHELRGGAFLPTFKAIANIRDARERFLAQHGDELQGVGAIRASSRRWIRDMLMQVAKWKSVPGQPRVANWHLIRQAAGVDPTVVFTRDGMRFVAKSAVGPHGLRWARLLLARPRRDQPR